MREVADTIIKATIAFALLFTAVIAVSGCSTASKVLKVGATANDAALEAAESVVCGDIAEKAIIRRYGHNGERARARRILCGYPEEIIMP